MARSINFSLFFRRYYNRIAKFMVRKRSTELTPKSHHDLILQHVRDTILSLSKDENWVSFGS